MNIRILNVKHKIASPKTVHWQLSEEVKYPAQKVNPMTWGIFNQQEMKLKPREVKHTQLRLGFMMSEGVVLVSLANSLKFKGCSLKNEVSLENTEDIVITLTNNLDKDVNIEEKELLCRVCYKKI